MADLNEARKKLECVLGESLKTQYFSFLRQWLLFNPTLTKDEFDQKVRLLFQNDEQVSCHNNFLLAILTKVSSGTKAKSVRQANNKGLFESADFPEYIQSINSHRPIPSEYTYPRAAVELFAPYSGLINCRINVVAWECGMDGAESAVTIIIAHACQTFLKNIITAMISKAKGFKVRDSKFQYGFNLPIPDPYIRNSNNVLDNSTGSGIVDAEKLLPKCTKSLERTQYERAFAYAASKKIKTAVTLDTKLLYETIRNQPKLIGQHSIHSVQSLKLSLLNDEEQSFTKEDSD